MHTTGSSSSMPAAVAATAALVGLISDLLCVATASVKPKALFAACTETDVSSRQTKRTMTTRGAADAVAALCK